MFFIKNQSIHSHIKIGIPLLLTMALAACQLTPTKHTDVHRRPANPIHNKHTIKNDINMPPFAKGYDHSMAIMHDKMIDAMTANNADVAFAKGMLPHHQGAVAMAEIELKYGKDKVMRHLAKDIIKAQQGEIELMQKWLDKHPDTDIQEYTKPMKKAYQESMAIMHDKMMDAMTAHNADVAFAKGMLPHHQGAVAMAEIELKYGKDEVMRHLAKDIIKAQQGEIELMQKWLDKHTIPVN